jgi:4-amino-4-deoxy-L-arabinose transferase-like glycosyltransferase
MAREMLESGFSAMPTLGREPFLEKPPLFFWLAAASYRLFGVGEAAERAPTVVFATVAILAAYAIARATSGRRAALVAAVVTTSFSTFWSVGHRGVNDVILGAAVACGHACLVRARRMAEEGRGLSCALGAGFAAGVAFMAKGIIGPALIAGPATLTWLVLRDGVVLRRVFPWLALTCSFFVAAFGVPWAVALSHHPGGWRNVYECTLGQMIGRVLGDQAVGPHSHAVWFYFVSGWGSVLPWAVLLPLILLSPIARRRIARRPLLDAGLFFLMGIVLLSIPSGKRASYLFPLLPVAAAVPADWLSRLRQRETWGRFGLRWLLAFAAVGGIVVAGVVFMLATGRAPTAKLAPIAALGARPVTLLAGVATVAAGLWLFRLSSRFDRDSKVRAAVRGFVVFVAVGVVLSHAIGRPFLEPMNVLHPGARKIAAAIPADEPLVAYNASETLRAMVPFYGGRWVVRVQSQDVLGELAAKGARHLVVMNDTKAQPPPGLLDSFEAVAKIDERDGFDVTIYRVR